MKTDAILMYLLRHSLTRADQLLCPCQYYSKDFKRLYSNVNTADDGVWVINIPPHSQMSSCADAFNIIISTCPFHRNEEEVGSALKKCGIPRDEIYVTTKVHPMERMAVWLSIYPSLTSTMMSLNYWLWMPHVQLLWPI